MTMEARFQSEAVSQHRSIVSNADDQTRRPRLSSSAQRRPVIGFRNADEHSLVIGGKLRYSGLLLGADPPGILFRNSAERLAWLSGQRRRVDPDEAATQWSIARQQYEECHNAGGSNCRNPGPPPK